MCWSGQGLRRSGGEVAWRWDAGGSGAQRAAQQGVYASPRIGCGNPHSTQREALPSCPGMGATTYGLAHLRHVAVQLARCRQATQPKQDLQPEKGENGPMRAQKRGNGGAERLQGGQPGRGMAAACSRREQERGGLGSRSAAAGGVEGPGPGQARHQPRQRQGAGQQGQQGARAQRVQQAMHGQARPGWAAPAHTCGRAAWCEQTRWSARQQSCGCTAPAAGPPSEQPMAGIPGGEAEAAGQAVSPTHGAGHTQWPRIPHSCSVPAGLALPGSTHPMSVHLAPTQYLKTQHPLSTSAPSTPQHHCTQQPPSIPPPQAPTHLRSLEPHNLLAQLLGRG